MNQDTTYRDLIEVNKKLSDSLNKSILGTDWPRVLTLAASKVYFKEVVAQRIHPLDIEFAFCQVKTLLRIAMLVDADQEESQLKGIEDRTTFLRKFAATLLLLKNFAHAHAKNLKDRDYQASEKDLDQFLITVKVMQGGFAVYGHDDHRKAMEAFESGDYTENFPARLRSTE